MPNDYIKPDEDAAAEKSENITADVQAMFNALPATPVAAVATEEDGKEEDSKEDTSEEETDGDEVEEEDEEVEEKDSSSPDEDVEEEETGYQGSWNSGVDGSGYSKDYDPYAGEDWDS